MLKKKEKRTKKEKRAKDEKEAEEKERIRQICSEWARSTLLLASSESLKVFRALGTPNSLGQDPLGRQEAIVRLAKMAEELVPKLSVIKTKTGPKPRHARNPTDDDLATLWSCIRMILELPGRKDIPSIIAATMSVLSLARDYLEKHLLLTDGEANLVRFHLTSWIRSSGNPSGADESWRTPDNLKEVDPRVGLRQWASEESSTDALQSDQAAHSNRSERLNAALFKLARLMELDEAALTKAKYMTFHRDTEGKERCDLECPDFKSVQDLKLRKTDILWSVIGRLNHLRILLHETQFAWKPDEAEYLGFMLESEISASMRTRSTTGISTVVAGLRVVRRIIITAALRQGFSPFAEVFPEYDYPFPPPVLPGQTSAGLGDRSVSGNGHVESKTPPIGRKKRRKPQSR